MNAVMEACVYCYDINSVLRIFCEMLKPESCGVDGITYGTLLKCRDICCANGLLAHYGFWLLEGGNPPILIECKLGRENADNDGMCYASNS
ncbi:hypothetical protein GH714_014309 [Hevea brasiliensis]|uniref:Pentatricopeptide repeat-containing protein n=1 Tax=Hevea brasiliensis TaxID=3981 RepID=A0A6A6KPD1_HEVBR|nr:hypothetical protein GH714_014309 [Hevea brasiliensis]